MIRVLFKLIDKLPTKKRLIAYIFIIPLFFISSLVIIFDRVQYETLKNDLLDLSLSPNPEASEYFIKSMHIRMYIERLNYFVDFDNLLMKPLFELKDEYFDKGKALLPKNSSEDVFFWTLINRGIYGLSGGITNGDYSFDPVKVLTPKEFRSFHEKIYAMLLRYLDLKNDFNYDVEKVKNYRYIIAENLVNHYVGMYHYQFTGETKRLKKIKALSDTEYTKRLNILYLLFEKFSDKYLEFSNNKYRVNVMYHFTIVELLTESYYSKQWQLKSSFINNSNCSKEDLKILIQNLKKLVEEKNDFVISNLIYKNGTHTYHLIKMINRSCRNLKTDTNEILPLFKRSI